MKRLLISIAFSLIVGVPISYSSSICFITKKVHLDDPYEKICFVFIGKPSKSKVQPLLEAVMKKYNLPVNNENIMKAASCVLTLRKQSSIGITEMEILRHMYKQGSNKLKFPDQAAISAVLLEKSK